MEVFAGVACVLGVEAIRAAEVRAAEVVDAVEAVLSRRAAGICGRQDGGGDIEELSA